MAACISTESNLDLAELFHSASDSADSRDAQRQGNADTIPFVRICVSDPSSSEEREPCELAALSADQMVIVSAHPRDVGEALRANGSLNHEPWDGSFQVTRCTPLDQRFEITLAPVATDSKHTPDSEPPTGSANLTVLAPQFQQITEAYRSAWQSWSQLGNTVRKLIAKAVAQFPDHRDSVSTWDQREGPRHAAELGATMVLVDSSKHHAIPMQVTDVSEGGLGGRIPVRMVDQVNAAIQAGQYLLHAGIPVMIAFATGTETLWMPAEIVHCDYRATDGIRFGVQFLTPGSLQFFGA